MKQLQKLILILSCVFLLPFVYGGLQGEDLPQDKGLHVLSYHGEHRTVCPNPHYRTATVHRFNLRNRGLNDYNEFFLFVSSIRIKPLFVYIHPRYKGFTESYISVSVSLSDWRGPPVA